MKNHSLPALRLLTFLAVVSLSLAALGQTKLAAVNVGASSVTAVTVTIQTAGALGAISVRTMGAEGLDYTNAGGGSCAVGTVYAANSSCTVKVTFRPRFSGARNGAVVLLDGNGNLMGTEYVEGNGQGPQATILSGAATLLDAPFAGQSFAVDGAGNIFVDSGPEGFGLYEEVPSSGGYSTVRLTEYDDIGGLALDGAGFLSFNDAGSEALARILPAADGNYSVNFYPPNIPEQDFGCTPNGIAIDGLGDLYGLGSSGCAWEEKLSDGVFTFAVLANGPICPGAEFQIYESNSGLAVDPSRNLYLSAQGSPDWCIFKFSPQADGSYVQSSFATQLQSPNSPVSDGNGDIFLADYGDLNVPGLKTIFIESPQTDGSYTQIAAANGHIGPLALDANNNLYTDGGKYVINLANPAPLAFPNTGIGQSSAAQVVTVVNTGNAELKITDVSFPADFPEASTATGACAAETTLAAGASCTLTVKFAPVAALGSEPLSESVTITSNSLNAAGTVQTIPVTGTEVLPVPTVTLTTSADPSPVAGKVTLTAKVASVGSEGTPTGMVTFYAGSTSLGAATLTSGAATLSTSTLAAGSYSITAHYGGSATYNAAVSNAIDEVVGKAAPTLKIASSGNPAAAGAAVTFTATVSGVSGGSVPTGTVTFSNGTATLATRTLSGGTATYATSTLAGGANAISISYSGDALYDASVSAPITETIFAAATMTAPAALSTFTGSSVTFDWSNASSATGYYLWIGSIGVGSNNLYNSAEKTVTSYTFTQMPTNGETIYVRLNTNYNGTWVYNDYVYYAATNQPATMTSPAQGASLGGSSVTFNWTAATGASGYYLWIGSTGAGSNNIYNSAEKTVTSYTFTQMPTNGETIYVRLNTNYNGTWVHNDYTYTAYRAPAALTSPAAGSTLSGSSVTFTWTAPTGATGYYLWIGSTGVGSNNIYNSAEKTVTSYTFTQMPTNGETIYVRLNTNYNGTWVHNDYTFKAAP